MADESLCKNFEAQADLINLGPLPSNQSNNLSENENIDLMKRIENGFNGYDIKQMQDRLVNLEFYFIIDKKKGKFSNIGFIVLLGNVLI